MASQVTANNESGQQLVHNGIDVVLYHTQHIESRQDRLREFDVLRERDSRVVAPPNRIGRCNNRTPRLECSHDTSFSDGDRLLFHCLVNRRPVCIVHFVELVDEASSVISQNECPSFQRPLARDGVLADTGRKTDGRRTLTRCEYRSMCGLFDVLEELRLCSTRVAEKKDVDVSTNTKLIVNVLCDSAEQGESDGSLDVFMTVDRGRD